MIFESKFNQDAKFNICKYAYKQNIHFYFLLVQVEV